APDPRRPPRSSQRASRAFAGTDAVSAPHLSGCSMVMAVIDTALVWRVLEGVSDPEIPVVSVVDLGIVRGVREDRVTITPTYTGCPATQVIQNDIRAALDLAGYRDVAIETVLSPPWTTDWIS